MSFLNIIILSGNIYLDQTRTGPYVANLLSSTSNSAVNLSGSVTDSIFGISQAVVSVLTENAPKTCYSTDTATKFITVIESVIASLKTSGQYSSVVAKGLSTTILTINQCQSVVRVCGEKAYTYTGSTLRYQLQSSQYSNSFNIFNSTFRNLPISDCARFSARRFPFNGVINLDVLSLAGGQTYYGIPRVLGISSTLSQINVTNSTGFPLSFANGTLTTCLDIEQGLSSLYGNDKSQYNYGVFQITPFEGSFDNITISTFGITVVNQTATNVCFNATSVGNFGALVQKVAQVVPTTTSSVSGSSISGISTSSTSDSTSATPAPTTKSDARETMGGFMGLVIGFIGVLVTVWM